MKAKHEDIIVYTLMVLFCAGLGGGVTYLLTKSLTSALGAGVVGGIIGFYLIASERTREHLGELWDWWDRLR